MKHFNQLTPAEAERLALLAEECGEIIQIVGKILRHGYESHDPTKPSRAGEPVMTNRDLLTCELGDYEAAMKMMLLARDVDSEHVAAAMCAKEKRVGRYLHHQSSR